jgi:hypothetical protein
MMNVREDWGRLVATGEPSVFKQIGDGTPLSGNL